MATLRDQDWSTLIKQIYDGRLIPVISDRFYWDSLGDSSEMVEQWAQHIGYPGASLDRSRIAQFAAVEFYEEYAKREYLHFLKQRLVYMAEANPSFDRERLIELEEELDRLTVAELVARLDYKASGQDPSAWHEMLAQLPLPIYVTTSYHDALERALLAAGKSPRSEICLWRDGLANEVDATLVSSPGVDYTPDEPLVFHLFGMGMYPSSLVLLEDDHYHFLTKLAREPDIVPPLVRRALTLSSLLLFGYQIRDWEFRVVYRGLILGQTRRLRRVGVVTQQEPRKDGSYDPYRVRKFLEEYFGNEAFAVYWGTRAFLDDLWKRWRNDTA